MATRRPYGGYEFDPDVSEDEYGYDLPEAAILSPEDEALEIVGAPPELDEYEAEEFEASPFESFLERFGASGGIQMNRPPRTFLEGLLYGAGQGFAGRGQKVAKAREKFEAGQSTRMAQRNKENLEATRAYQQRLQQTTGTIAGERRAQQRELDKEARAEKRKGVGELVQIDTPQGPRYVTRDEALGKAPPKSAKAPDDQPLVEVLGPDGSPMWVRRSDAVGKKSPRADKTPKPATGVEKDALDFYLSMENALKTIEAGDPGGSLEEQLNEADKIGLSRSPDWALNPNQRRYRQAQRTFTEARLRQKSGAAINKDEYVKDALTFFAQPGDDPATLAQKRAARAVVMNGLKFKSGRAYVEYFGDEAGPLSPIGSAASRTPLAPMPEIPSTWKRVP